MLIHQHIYSQSLEMGTDLYVLRPQVIKEEKPIYLLYLLHGYSGDYSNWIRYTNVEKYVDGKNIIVVMPSGLNMYYVNTEGWYDYFTYLTEELPQIIKETYRLPFTRENTFIAGLSMGGYGAMKAILQTNNYAKAASFSGALDINRWSKEAPQHRMKKFETIFSKTLKEGDDIYKQVEQNKDKDIEIYLSCGTEDGFIIDNDLFSKTLKQHGIKHQYYRKPGKHDWVFWDQEIKEALKFFKL